MLFSSRRLVGVGQGLLVLLPLLLDSSVTLAQVYRRFDFESPFSILNTDRLPEQSCIDMQPSTSWNLTDGKSNFYALCKGRPNQPWLSEKHYCQGQKSLAFQYPNNSDHLGFTQKINLWYGHQTFDQPWWTGFAIKIGSGKGDYNRFESPPSDKDWVILSQWWQAGNSIPPMRLVVEPTDGRGQLNWHLAINNNSNSKQAEPGKGFVVNTGETVPFRGKIQKGKWNTFVFSTTFRAMESGKPGSVRMWQNRLPVKVTGSKAMTWNGYVGFDMQPTSTYQPPADLFRGLILKQGIYRRLQARHQTVFFDELSVFNGVDGFKQVQPGDCLNGK
jgi:hypothetical protein